MKSFLIIFFALVTVTSITHAQTETPLPTTLTETPARQPLRDRTITLQPQTQTRITNLSANISNRLDAYINRLQSITTRLSSRLDKLQATGIDVSIARASLLRAQTALDAAKADMRNIDDAVAMVTSSNEPLQAWREVRVRFLSARDNIRVTFDELRTVMIDIRGALTAPPASSATSTSQVSN